jgi:glycosyltransferase involved in cell wall biosynthesis
MPFAGPAATPPAYTGRVIRPPRKVLLIVNALIHGGAEVQLMHLAVGLAQSGHEVTLCCVDGTYIDPQPLERAGVEIVSLHAQKRLQRMAALPRLVRLARRSDIVHCTIWDASLWGRIAAILARRPVVVADHATDRSIHVSSTGASRASWIALHNRVLDRFTYATVACATSQREVLLGEGVSPGKIVHIANGLPIAQLVASAANGPSREDLGIPQNTPLVMQVGVFRQEKNQLGALEAIARMRNTVKDAQLVFVGDGPNRARVEERMSEIGASWTHFLGYRSDVPALLALADIMVQPSIADAMPMTVLEAMALGVPVVATDVGDVCSMIDGGAGICVPPNDLEAIAQACTAILSDEHRRTAMGAAAAKRAAAFDSSAMVHSYGLLFHAACDGRAPTNALHESDMDNAAPVAT